MRNGIFFPFPRRKFIRQGTYPLSAVRFHEAPERPVSCRKGGTSPVNGFVRTPNVWADIAPRRKSPLKAFSFFVDP